MNENKLLIVSFSAECSSSLLTRYHDCQWCAGLFSLLFLPTIFFLDEYWGPSQECFLALFAWFPAEAAAAACARHSWGQALGCAELALFTCFHHQTYVPIGGALKLRGCSLTLLKRLPAKLNPFLFLPSPSPSARGCYWRRGRRAWCY